MKKSLLTTFALTGLLVANAQVQRLELYEEFTGENCGPCAATNPGLTTLIGNNQTPNRKILLLRYQTAIPSAPPAGSLYQDNTADPQARQSYYSVPFAPYARLDGVELPDPSGNGNDGHAGLLTQTIINNNYLVNSPVSVATSHAYNSTYDSLTISITVTAAQAFTPVGSLKLRVALIEKEIHFATPPGTNGEKDFEWIMRKMLPSATGTSMTAGAWTNGQTQSFTLKAKIPTYIKDKTQMAIIAWVQDDGDKSVKNAGFSDAIPFPIDDASLVSTSVPNFQCTSTVTPTLVLKNSGSPALTSATITYSVDGGAPQTYNFAGNLASQATTTVTLAPQSGLSSGTHTLSATVSAPNGQTDLNTVPDTKTSTFVNWSTSAPSPITQDFASTTFPPALWASNDVGGDGVVWQRRTGISGSASGVAAARIFFYGAYSGEVDDLFLPYTSLGSSSQLTFYVASAPYSSPAENDMLEFAVSSDCGVSWTTLYSKSGATLNTVAAATSSFTPTTAGAWRQETVNLSSFDNQNNLLMKFIGTSDYGNNLYIDDINLTTTGVGIKETNNIAGVYVYPNPASDVAQVKIAMYTSSNVTVNIYNTIGELVYSQNQGNLPAGDNKIQLNTSALASGIYSIVVNSDEGKFSQKLIINR